MFRTFIDEQGLSNQSLGIHGHSRSLAFDALKIRLPNPESLTFEDILELKHTLKDELSLFYQTINAIEVKHKQLFTADISAKEYEGVFFTEIQKTLNELELKLKNLKSKTFRKFIERMQNPKSYVPLIGTVVASLPMEFSLLTSFGLTAGQTYLEFAEERREIRNNGLYFLFQLK